MGTQNVALCFAVPPTVLQISYKTHLLMYNLSNALIKVEVKVEVSSECESFRPQLIFLKFLPYIMDMNYRRRRLDLILIR